MRGCACARNTGYRFWDASGAVLSLPKQHNRLKLLSGVCLSYNKSLSQTILDSEAISTSLGAPANILELPHDHHKRGQLSTGRTTTRTQG